MESLSLTNWRAFKYASFKFSKLNIFVGPNNSGKSSALSALNVLAQTVDPFSAQSGPLVLNGPYDQLGTYKDTVHGGFGGTPMKFCCEYTDVKIEWDLKYRPQRREIDVTRFKITSNGQAVYEYTSNSSRYDIFILGKSLEDLGLVSYKRRPVFRGVIPYFNSYEIRKDFRGKKDEKEREISSLLMKCDEGISTAQDRFYDEFLNFESLGPFRVQPQRTYLFSGEAASSVGHIGENTINLLANDASKRGAERVGYLDIISNWLRRTNITQQIKVRNLTDRHYEISLLGRDGKDHNIRDVGFGISQVLPVLVAGIKHTRESIGSPMLIVQEPEIHLHPNAQAELGTFFASVAKYPGQIFLETHSDSLVLRIARHVALGDLSPSDVRIYYVRGPDSPDSIFEMQIDESGSFRPDWPVDFFPQRQIESFELARVAVAKERGKAQKQLTLFEF